MDELGTEPVLAPPGWELVGVVIEGEPIDIRGVDPWRQSWSSSVRVIPVAHPSYPQQRHSADVFVVANPDGQDVTFAAAELSNGVYAFFLRTGS